MILGNSVSSISDGSLLQFCWSG